MRLQPYEIKAIGESAATMDSAAKVWLFGSRADDAKRGGDIDLLVISSILKSVRESNCSAAPHRMTLRHDRHVPRARNRKTHIISRI